VPRPSWPVDHGHRSALVSGAYLLILRYRAS
jgi:hypothetical protein